MGFARTASLLLVVTLLAFGPTGCGDDKTTSGPAAGRAGAGPVPAPLPAPLPGLGVGPAPAGSVPPGLDPKVVQDYADALVPPPVAFAASDLRKEAAAAGAFEGVPAADAEDLHALLEALVEAKHAAHGSPGTSVGGPAGPEYRPSREELRLAEIVDRLRAAMTAAPAEEVRAAWKSAGLGDGPTQVQTFWTVTVKVFGTGYVTVVEPRTETLAPP